MTDLSKLIGGMTKEELEYAELLSCPEKWAQATFGWTARDYQLPLLEVAPDTKQLVLRLGRRLGKTEVMCILILWYAFTQVNTGPNNQYDILILTPFEAQIDLIFERLHELIELSPEIKSSIKRDVTHQLEFHNNAVVRGLTVGSKSNTGAANTRGQRADLIILDEVDYMMDADITNVLNIRNEDPTRIRIIAASTPSGARSKYFEWCTRSSKDHQAVVDESGIGFVRYVTTERKGRAGNGWTHFFAPSIVNTKLLEINPDTEQTYLNDLRDELTEMRFEQEVMAGFGEDAMGVFQKKHLDKAIERGREINLAYKEHNFDRVGPRVLAIDWDKYGASTNMVGMQLNQADHLMEPFVRKEIPRGAFTFDNAVTTIIDLNEKYQFDWIFCDSGHGEHQIETLRKYGMKNPTSGLAHKVVRINFSEKISMFDPITRKMEKKDIKPFMVNNAVIAFERGHVALNPADRKTIKQLEDYHVKRISNNGRPIFGEQEEHIVDCVMMCIHAFNVKYSDMMKVHFSTRMHSVNRHGQPAEDTMVPSREVPGTQAKELDVQKTLITGIPMAKPNMGFGPRVGFRGRNSMPSRSRF